MKKIFNVFKAVIAITVLLLTFVACDKDYATIGSNIIGDSNFQSTNFSYPVISYNKKLEAVQTNNLPSNFIGYYDDPIYGTTNASIVSQMAISTTSRNSSFGVNAIMDSVVLSIPYYSHVDSDSDTGYALDSVYGNLESEIKISVYRNNYFLSDFDSETNFEDSQKYYSNGVTSSGGMISEPDESDLLFSDLDAHIDYPIPSSKAVVLTTVNEDDPDGEDEVTETLSPRLRLTKSDTESLEFWKELIIDKEDQLEISNTSNFNDYFRGLYIKSESIDGVGQMVMLNTASSNANITIHYRSITDTDEDGDGIPDDYDTDLDETPGTDSGNEDIDTNLNGISDEAEVVLTGGEDLDGDGFDDEIVIYTDKTIVLNFSGNVINLFDNEFNPTILQEIENSSPTTGDEKLYLKGGEGSMAVIDLFNGLVEDENGNEIDAFDHFESKFKDEDGEPTKLINEAYLVFYEDENSVTSDLEDEHQYDRLYLYNLEENQPILDYYYDLQSTTSPYYSVINHLGQRYTDESGNNKFKIKITEHIKNILFDDDTPNVKLGLVTSTNVNSYVNSYVLGTVDTDDVSNVPSGSVLSARGTVLYGNSNVSPDKKVELEIYYTEPNN